MLLSLADTSVSGGRERSTTAAAVRPSMQVLQAFRGLAAALVVVFHVSHSIFRLPKYWMARPFGDLFEFGHAGVEFFFVLSGFIIYYVHRRDIGQPRRLAAFAWKRIRRIYPVYWVVLVLITPIFYLFHSTGTGTERLPSVWLDSVLLVRLMHGGGQVVSVSWTLFHEVLFYGVFALSILHRRAGGVIFAAWMLAAAGVYVWGAGLSEMLQFYLSPLHLLFGMGALAAWFVGRGSTAAPLRLTLLGAAIFLTTAGAEVAGAAGEKSATLSLCYGVGSALLVVGAVGLERAGRLVVPRFLIVLGDASYSIYLVHFLALSVLAKLIRRLVDFGAPLPPVLVFVVLAGAGIAFGLAFYAVIEAPLLHWVSGRKTAPPPARTPAVEAR